ncbi:MAG: HNH endonuclease [Terracidiphilus sp.]|jgi:hypothetical protein
MTCHIAPFPFKELFLEFKSLVEKKSGMRFHSFKGTKYTFDQEGYKEQLYKLGREALAIETWKPDDIGTGIIAKRMVKAIELPTNNLFPTDKNRWGSQALLHKSILEAANDGKNRQSVESCIYDIYWTDQDDKSFAKAVGTFGKKYPLLAYLFFLKDCSRYVPVEPKKFDFVFPMFGAEFKTAGQCSWNNYAAFIGLISELKLMLAEELKCEVTLLDAHSFAWMVAGQLESDGLPEKLKEYNNLGPTEREAITLARIGQGRFRQGLLEYWKTCAVTGCTEQKLLDAAHIKPWGIGTVQDCYCVYNGLLLAPALHRCLDKGYITFSETGEIIISARLSAGDRRALGIDADLKLRKLEAGHKPFLEYHRAWYEKLHTGA